MSSTSDKIIGDIKDKVGQVTGNDKVEAEGKAQHAKGEAEGKVEEAGQAVSDKVDEVAQKLDN